MSCLALSYCILRCPIVFCVVVLYLALSLSYRILRCPIVSCVVVVVMYLALSLSYCILCCRCRCRIISCVVVVVLYLAFGILPSDLYSPSSSSSFPVSSLFHLSLSLFFFACRLVLRRYSRSL